MKTTAKTLVILVLALMMSSALFAKSGEPSGCSGRVGSDGTVWTVTADSGLQGELRCPITSTKSSALVNGEAVRNDKSTIPSSGLRAVLGPFSSLIEAAVWTFTPPPKR